MPNINKVIIAGHLGKDPELKTLQNGNNVCSFSVATTERFGKGDEKKEKTTWHRIVAWGKTAEICAKYLSKGKAALITGRIETREYEDKSGTKKQITEIIADDVQFLSPKSGDASKNYNDEDIPF